MGYHETVSSQRNAPMRAKSDPVDAALAGSSLKNLWTLMQTALSAKDEIILDLRANLKRERQQLAASEADRRDLDERAFLLAAELDALRLERRVETRPRRTVRSWLLRRR